MKIYAIVNNKYKTLVQTFEYYGAIPQLMDSLEKNGEKNLQWFNITHSKCPQWVIDLVNKEN